MADITVYPLRSIWTAASSETPVAMTAPSFRPTLYVDEELALRTTLIPMSSPQEVDWTVSDGSVVSLRAEGSRGVVTGLKAGKATVTADGHQVELCANIGKPEDAKKVVFAGEEEKYANFIKKIDHYHYTIMTRAGEILKEASDNGIKISSIVKYGNQQCPGIEDSNALSDQLVKVSQASLGAYTCGNDTYFSESYVKSETAKGNGKYISPDLKINASTCMFPDNTWFVKNLRHKTFPDSMNALVCEMINAEGTYTVFDSAEWPQYMVYDEETETASPMTEENCNTTDRWKTNFFKNLIIVFKNIGYVLKKLFG